MSRFRLSPSTYRWFTLAALLSLCFIVITGAAVRLTGSGLGCPDWPTCESGRVVAPWDYHAMVEFVNRTITGLVSIAVIVAVLGSLARVPRRRDLVWLSCGLVGGVIGQIVLGGLTVLFELKPGFVMAHFLLSMVLLANAIVLHRRASEPAGQRQPVVDRSLLTLGRLLTISAGIAIFLGTVVTSSGPHGGDEHAERLSFALPDVTRVHGISVVLFLVLTLVTVWKLNRARAPAHVLRRAEILIGVSTAQAAVGYAQYFTGVPVILVGVHVAGAVAVWLATLNLVLAFRSPAASNTAAASTLVGAVST